MEMDYYKTKKPGSEDFDTSWNVYPELLKIIKVNNGEDILDAGCGRGILADFLRHKKIDLYGIDLSEMAIKEAKMKSYAKVKKSDIYNIKFPGKKFDRTISIQLFQYLKEPEKAFEELLRITKKEIVITVTNFNWFWLKSVILKRYRKRFLREIEDEQYTNKDFLENLGKKHGLKVKIRYLSNKYSVIRNLFGNWLASEVIGIYKLK